MPDHYPDTTNKGISASKLLEGSPALGKESNVGKLANITRRVTIRVGKVEKRSAINSEKITKLKDITKLRKENVDKKIGKGESSPGLLNALEGINSNVDGMLAILGDRLRFEKKVAGDDRKRAEKAKRGASEKRLESKAFDGLKKTGQKVLGPAMSLWDRLMNFIGTVLLGRIAIKLFKWFTDKENQKKVAAIGRFFKDWWPILLSSYLIFGTGFIKMAAGLLKVVGWGVTKIVALIPKITAALAKLKVGRILKLLPGGGKLGGIKGLTGMFQMGAGAFAEGGVVPGSGSGDTVPAMLTPGEFVMSKGAVQKYGVDTLAGMNAAGGGTNVPKGLPGLEGGGGGTNSLTEQAKVKTFGSALGDFFSGDDGRSRRKTAHDKWMEMAGGGLVQYFSGGGIVGTREQKWDQVRSMAIKAGAKYPNLVAAQFALESDWGTAVGGKHNYYGLKAYGSESGTTSDTWEEEGGKRVDQKAVFKNFNSPQEATNFLVSRWYKNWKGYIGVNNAYVAAERLKQQDYMTDSKAPGKLKNLMNQYSNVPVKSGDNRTSGSSGSAPKGSSGKESVLNSSTGRTQGKNASQGFMRGLSGFADWATFGIWDFDQRGNLFGGKHKRSGYGADSASDAKEARLKSGAFKGYVDDEGNLSMDALLGKTSPSSVPGPPNKPTTTVAYDKAMMDQTNGGMPQPQMRLPQINASAMISIPKITTLGISV